MNVIFVVYYLFCRFESMIKALHQQFEFLNINEAIFSNLIYAIIQCKQRKKIVKICSKSLLKCTLIV